MITALYRRIVDPRYLPLIVTTVPLPPLVVKETVVTDAFSPPFPPRHPAIIAIIQYRGRVIPSVLADTNIDRVGDLVSLWSKSLSQLHATICGSTSETNIKYPRNGLGEHDEQKRAMGAAEGL